MRVCYMVGTYKTNEEGPWGGRNICLLAFIIYIAGDEDGGNVGAEEQQIHEHVNGLWLNCMSHPEKKFRNFKQP